MPYDVFTDDEALAERIRTHTTCSFTIDETDHPPVYQFFSLPKSQLKGIENELTSVEIRDSKNGLFIWPNDRGLSLIESLYGN